MRVFAKIFWRRAAAGFGCGLLGGCLPYVQCDRVVTVTDLQTHRPAAHQAIDFDKVAELAFGFGPNQVSALLDENGHARLKLPTLAMDVRVGGSGGDIEPKDVSRGVEKLLLCREVITLRRPGGPVGEEMVFTHDFDPRRTDRIWKNGDMFLVQFLGPRYEVTIAKP